MNVKIWHKVWFLKTYPQKQSELIKMSFLNKKMFFVDMWRTHHNLLILINLSNA